MPETSIFSEFTDDPGFRELMDAFMAGLPDHQKALTEAFAASDWDHLREEAHELKGSGGGYGFPKLTDLAAQLEISSRERLTDRIEADFNALQDYLDRLVTGT